jgi:coenzyme F420-reducing hydrogenase beta subunit
MTTMLAWATDKQLRRDASSGGFTRAMLRFMLKTNTVDGAIIARTGPKNGGFAPDCIATDDPDELTDRRTCSVYYPVAPLAVQTDAKLLYAATLLPCQVEALWAMQGQGFYREIGYVFELLCHHTPTGEFTAAICSELKADPTNGLVYRGNGWPGEVEVDGHRAAQPRMWGRYGAPMLHRCRRCRRTHSTESDWVVADPWLIDSVMGDGKTLVHVNTQAASDLVRLATEAGCIEWEPVAESEWERRMVLHERRRDT